MHATNMNKFEFSRQGRHEYVEIVVEMIKYVIIARECVYCSAHPAHRARL